MYISIVMISSIKLSSEWKENKKVDLHAQKLTINEKECGLAVMNNNNCLNLSPSLFRLYKVLTI